MSSNMNLVITLKMKGQDEIEQLFSEIGKKHNIDIQLDTSKIQASVNQLKQPIKDFGRNVMHSFSQIGFAISGIRQTFGIFQGMANTFVEPASQFEQLRIRLTNLYQDQEKANEVFEEFKKIAATTPYELQNVVNAGAQLKAFGINAEETLKSVADLAAFMGVDVVEAANAVGRAYAGGAGAADVLRDRGVLQLIKSFKGIEDLSDLTLPEFREAMLETFVDPAAGIAGATTELSNSYIGAVSNMKDALTAFRAEIGSKFTPLLQKSASRAAEFIKEITANSVEQLDTINQKISDFGKTENVLRKLEKEYISLTSKAKLNKDEQVRLKQVIGEIAEIAPEAATGFNVYGEALGVNISKIDDFIKGQRVALRLQFQKAIGDITKSYKDAMIRYSNLYSKQSTAQQTLNTRTKEYVNYLQAINRQYGSIEKAPDNIKEMIKKYNRLYIAAKTAYTEANRDYTSKTPGIFKDINHMIDALSGVGVNFAESPENIAYQLGLSLKEDRALIDAMISRWKILNSKQMKPVGNADEPDILPSQNEIDKAKETMSAFFLSIKSEKDQLEAEFNSKKSLLEVAFADDPEGLQAKLTELTSWYENEQEKLRKEEIDAERNRYEAELKLIETKRNLGMATERDLMEVQQEYMNWLKETYGEDSEQYLSALENKEKAKEQFWRENYKLSAAFVDTFVNGFKSMWGTILDESMTGRKRLEAIWDSMKRFFVNAVGEMVADYIKAELSKIAIAETVGTVERAEIIKTEGVQKASLLSTIALKIKSAMVTIGETIAAGFKWLVSTLGPFGLAAGIALGAGIIAAFNGIRSQLGFRSGGYTGDGDKNETAGVVHKEEIVFEAEITKPNLTELLGLRRLLQKGYKLKDLLMPSIQLPMINVPAPQFAYAGGGYTSESSIDFGVVTKRLERIEKAIKNKQFSGILEMRDKRSGVDRYEAHLKDKAEYERKVK